MSGSHWLNQKFKLKPGVSSFFLKFRSDGSTEYWGYKFTASVPLQENVNITQTSWASDLKRSLGVFRVMSIYPMMRVPPAVLTSLSAKPLNDDRSADNNSKFSIEDQDESLDKFAVMQAVMNDPLIRFGLLPDDRPETADDTTFMAPEAKRTNNSIYRPNKLLLNCIEGIGDGEKLAGLMRKRCRARDRGRTKPSTKQQGQSRLL